MNSIAGDLLHWLATTTAKLAFHTKVPQKEELPCCVIYRPEGTNALQTHSGGQTQAKEQFRIEIHSRVCTEAEELARTVQDALRDESGLLKAGSDLTVQAVYIEAASDTQQYNPVEGSDERVYACGFPASLFVSEV